MKKRFSYREQWDDEGDAIERLATDRDGTNEAGEVEPSLTQQHYKDDVDLNVMVERMGIRDVINSAPPVDPRYYGDFSDTADLRTAIQRSQEAMERFNALPAAIRKEFNNDPLQLHEWVTDPANAELAVEAGLLAKDDRHVPAAVKEGRALHAWRMDPANKEEAERLFPPPAIAKDQAGGKETPAPK